MTSPVLPGSTLGVLGGGQLGRMFCVAARTMGYHLVVFDPNKDSPAGRIADEHIQADFTDQQALDRFASSCDVITTEFENIPSNTLRYLEQQTTVFPSADNLEIAQNRCHEKQFAANAGLTPVKYEVIQNETQLADAFSLIGAPAILKSASLGYDGKGQAVVDTIEELQAAYELIGKTECILEEKIELELEISAIVTRNTRGETVVYPLSENEHRDGILHVTLVPARISEKMAQKACTQAVDLANALNYVGVIAVEFFFSKNETLYFNEMAPRPHNSGHYTKDACVTSQFEQQVRAMCGLVPGDTTLLSPVVMTNLLGDLWPIDWSKLLDNPALKLHQYGKTEARPGRKMGHYNVLDDDVEKALATAREIYDTLL